MSLPATSSSPPFPSLNLLSLWPFSKHFSLHQFGTGNSSKKGFSNKCLRRLESKAQSISTIIPSCLSFKKQQFLLSLELVSVIFQFFDISNVKKTFTVLLSDWHADTRREREGWGGAKVTETRSLHSTWTIMSALIYYSFSG